MVSDRYSAVYFTSAKKLAHHWLEHTHLDNLRSCFREISFLHPSLMNHWSWNAERRFYDLQSVSLGASVPQQRLERGKKDGNYLNIRSASEDVIFRKANQ